MMIIIMTASYMDDDDDHHHDCMMCARCNHVQWGTGGTGGIAFRVSKGHKIALKRPKNMTVFLSFWSKKRPNCDPIYRQCLRLRYIFSDIFPFLVRIKQSTMIIIFSQKGKLFQMSLILFKWLRNTKGPDPVGKLHPKKTRGNLGIAEKGGGVKRFAQMVLWQFFSEYKPLVSHLIFINFTNIYLDFHQNTISESSLTLVTVKIFIPKVKIAV